MVTTLCMSLVIMAFFGLVLHLVRGEEKRTSDRRQHGLPVPGDRRRRERRKKGLHAYLVWALGTLGSKLTK